MYLVCVKHSFCNLRPLTPRGGIRVVSGRFPDFTLKEGCGPSHRLSGGSGTSCGCSPSFDRRGVTVAGTVPAFHWIPFLRRGPDGLRCVTENGGKNRIRKQSRKGASADAGEFGRVHVGAYCIRASADACEFGRVPVGAYCIRPIERSHRAEQSTPTGHKKGTPICLGMPFNHSGVSVGRMQFAPTTGYPIPPAT